jgi:hypothetical protein
MMQRWNLACLITWMTRVEAFLRTAAAIASEITPHFAEASLEASTEFIGLDHRER